MTVSKPLRLCIIIVSLAMMGLANRNDGHAGQMVPAPAGKSALSNYVASQFAQSTDNLEAASGYVAAVLADDPDNPVLLQRAFELSLGAGQYPEALRFAARLHADDPANSTARFVLMADALRERKYEAASRYTDGLASSGIEGFLVPIIRAWIAQGEGRSADVIDAELARLDDVPAFRSYVREHRGYLALARGDDKAAVRELMPLVAEQSGGGIRVRQAIASALLEQGNRNAAIQIIESGRSLTTEPLVNVLLEDIRDDGKIANPVDTPARGVGQLFLRAGIDLGNERAVPLSLVLLRLAGLMAPDFPDVWLATATVLAQADQPSAAFDALRTIPKSSPLWLEARLAEARIYSATDEDEQALAVLEDIVKRYPDQAVILAQKADVLRQTDRFAEAAAYYSRALDLTPANSQDRWQLLYMRGVSYERARNWSQAEADLKAALALKPNDPGILNYLGYSWVEQRRNLPEAKAMLQQAVKLEPTDGFIVDSLGWAYFVSGDYAEAVRLLEQAVAVEPGDPTINDHLGDAYWMVGRTIEARYRWRAALASSPEPERIAEIARKADFGLNAVAALAPER